MGECRRCGAEITQADIQKGRALQRGEFFYCPACVQEARAAKGGGPATNTGMAPVSKGASGGMKPVSKTATGAMAPVSKAAPGGLKPPPPSSTKMRPAPAAKKQELIEEEPPAEEEEEAPVPAKVRGPASSRLGRPAAPASGKVRRPAPPPPPEEEEEPATSGMAKRKKIGFKNQGAPMGQPMSKQNLMIATIGGGAVCIIALVVFSTLVLGKIKANKEAKARLEIAKVAQSDFERVAREEKNNIQAIEEAYKNVEEKVKDTPLEPNMIENKKLLDKLISERKTKLDAKSELSAISGLLATSTGAVEALTRLKKVVKLMSPVGKSDQEDRDYNGQLLAVLRTCKENAEKLKAVEPKDWVAIDAYYQVVDYLGKIVSTEMYTSADSNAVAADIAEANEKKYEDPKFLESIAWTDLSGEDWKGDDFLVVSKSGGDTTLQNSTDAAALYWLNKPVPWKDYILQLEFTTDLPFQILQRTQPGQPPGATQDLEQAMAQNVFKANEKFTMIFWVYGKRFRMQFGDTKARAAICPPSAPSSGGVTIRVPAKTKLTIHKIQVKVLTSEADDSGR